MEDGHRTVFDRQGSLALYLKYNGRDVPRRTRGEINKHVVWEDGRPVLAINQERRRHMEVFAKVQESLDADETFTNPERNAKRSAASWLLLHHGLGLHPVSSSCFSDARSSSGLTVILTQVAEASEDALYRIPPWVLLALRGASGKLWAPGEPSIAAPDRTRFEPERSGLVGTPCSTKSVRAASRVK